jgi:pyruvate dehydrogenase (quinone)
MAQTVADFLLHRLRQWEIPQVFGFPGDGINGLLAAWGRAGNEPQLVQSRHEEMSAFEAVGYAKYSGRVRVCTATSGPGAVHLLNGLYDAELDHVPAVAIVGQTARSAMATASYKLMMDCDTLLGRRRPSPRRPRLRHRRREVPGRGGGDGPDAAVPSTACSST